MTINCLTAKRLLLFTLLVLMILPLSAQRKRKNKEMKQDTVVPALVETPKEEEKPKKKSPFKPYNKVITEDAVSMSGLWSTHRVGSKHYFEVPFDVLGKDILLVSRIAKIPSGLGGGYFNAGTKTNEQVIRLNRVFDKIHLTSESFTSVADEELPINLSVQNNNYSPLIMAFTIEAFNEDSTAAVISVDDFFLGDIPAISGLSPGIRKRYKTRGPDKKRSFISSMKAFPENVEIRHDMTYPSAEPPSNSRSGTISMQMAQSFYLLPEEPMMPRLYDRRVGWFTMSQVDYGSDKLKADEKTYLRRWRLEPKDPAAYARGELVEPVKPIVYYIDPATPEKFVPDFIAAVEDWQVAFEAAGFKNAIIAKLAPTPEEDPDWSPEDARYSVIRYVASTTRNATGPSVSDPRSGEIIESDIIWYHNHLRSYRNRYLLETGAANPAARTLETPDADIKEMMRRVISHEIGHALGLPHNMKASYAYPTDSLRSATFTQKWGLATTIMDYTRYNYVAQPGDEGVRWVRMLGPYDIYAINFGYRVVNGAQTPEAELPTLRNWIAEKENDPMYLFGARNSFDPSSQTESVGDDPIKASDYGLANLKIVAPNLAKWTATPGEGYDDLEELYGELLSVFSRYAGHVVSNVGGVYELRKLNDEPGFSYTQTNKNTQRESVMWLGKNVFTTPEWLLQEEVIRNIGPDGVMAQIRRLQERQLGSLLRKDRLDRLAEQTVLNGNEAYTLTAMLKDLRGQVWGDVSGGRNIDGFRRNLQRSHVDMLTKLMTADAGKRTDVSAAVRAELNSIRSLAKSGDARYSSGINRAHLRDVEALIGDFLETK